MGIDSRGGEESGVGSGVGEGKGRVTVVTTKEIIVVADEENTLNSLITRVTIGEIILSGLGASMRNLSFMVILNGLE